MKIRNLLIILFFIVIGCKDEFLLDLDSYNPKMVVEGFITNESGPYMVKISKSAPVNFLENIPYTDCIVTIVENTGNSEVLIETEPGIYLSSESGIQGIIGNEYSLSIITSEGEEYSSDFEELKAALEIENVTIKSEKILDIDYPDGLPGYQFYVDSKLAPQKDNFLLWSMTETYEYDIDYELAYMEDRFGDPIFYNPSYDALETCWKTEKVNYIYTASTGKLNIPQIRNQPIHFVSTESKRLLKRYSTLIKQYTIGQNAYNYWALIEEQSNNDNFFVGTQPYTIKGNIENINDESETILGYFTVASVSEKRIFANKPSDPFYINKCVVITDPKAIWEYKRNHGSPYYWVEIEKDVFGIVEKYCVDCRNEGGTTEKPGFWID